MKLVEQSSLPPQGTLSVTGVPRFVRAWSSFAPIGGAESRTVIVTVALRCTPLTSSQEYVKLSTPTNPGSGV